MAFGLSNVSLKYLIFGMSYSDLLVFELCSEPDFTALPLRMEFVIVLQSERHFVFFKFLFIFIY